MAGEGEEEEELREGGDGEGEEEGVEVEVLPPGIREVPGLGSVGGGALEVEGVGAEEAAEADGEEEEEGGEVGGEGRHFCLDPNTAVVVVGGGGGGGGRVNSSPLRTEEAAAAGGNDTKSSPRVLRGNSGGATQKTEERAKFAVALKRKEIEEDFMEMVGHRPPRRFKKRPKNVQKQLDLLFPGLWLTEISADTYKVDENPENGKR